MPDAPVTITLMPYEWEAILRGLASSGWDAMHRTLSDALADVEIRRQS